MSGQYLKNSSIKFMGKKMPDEPGVYLFKKNKTVLYIGKATSLKNRVQSYFRADLIKTRGPLLVDLLFKANKIDYIKTPSVLEALILETNLIKKYQPKYNTKEKDNKSFNYIVITKEDWPRVLIERGRNLFVVKENNTDNLFIFGPYPNNQQLKEALKVIRKIFPFRDRCLPFSGRPCFNCQIGLCPGVCSGAINRKDYQRIIKNIQLFLEGRKNQIIKNLKKEMNIFAKLGEYEKAAKIRNKIFSLNHIQDVALIKEDNDEKRIDNVTTKKLGSDIQLRIEAYDVAHLSGTNNVGVMVVMENGEFKKNDYRKFIIKKSKGNDISALAEILERRLKHNEWPYPNLIIIDGGPAQLNVAIKIFKELPFVKIVAVIKDNKHKPKSIIGDGFIIKKYKKDILLINNEAHRFAVKYHRSQRILI